MQIKQSLNENKKFLRGSMYNANTRWNILAIYEQ